MPDVLLRGCRTEPLGSYLKGLGVFRLIAEQLDPRATAKWQGDVLVVSSSAELEEMVAFFMHRYRPTPVIAPWNGRTITAFHKDKRRNPIRIIEATTDDRLEAIRRTIVATRTVYERGRAMGLDPRVKKEKEQWVRLCRNTFPDEGLDWIDAVVVLTTDAAAYPLLAGGTGGVLGSGDISLNFLEHVAALAGPPSEALESQLAHELTGEGRPKLNEGLIGQFDPGRAGGANVGRSLVNRWEFVLMIEGALLFTAAAARALGFGQTSTAAMPFTVKATAADFGSAAGGEDIKGEIWAPVWRRPVFLDELKQLLSEGRASWAGRQARTGLDFVRAAHSLGVDRGIDQFVRHSIGVRFGDANLAVPIGRVRVAERHGVPVMAQLDNWLSRLRRLTNPSAAVARGVRLVERAIFEAASTGQPRDFQKLLGDVAQLDRTLGRSGASRKEVGPISELISTDWLPLVEDESTELHLATGYASLRSEPRGPSALRTATQPLKRESDGRLVWRDRSPTIDGVDSRPILDVIAALAAHRAIEAQQQKRRGEGEGPGVVIGFEYAQQVPLALARGFFAGSFDTQKFERLVLALLCLSWRPGDIRRPMITSPGAPHPPAFSIVAPFGRHGPIEVDGVGQVRLLCHPRWPAMLIAGHVEHVLEQVLLRMAVARLRPHPLSPRRLAVGVNPNHLAASLLISMSRKGAASLIRDATAAHVPAT
ncbi:MAG: type I-G CRISPR-associated protein Cas8g1/Csx17 [Acidimicrobiia bacterium]